MTDDPGRIPSTAIAPETVSRRDGHCWIAKRIDLCESDSMATPFRSRLVLFEDGRPLGPPHSQHQFIVAKGGGGFSHWNGTLLFSTSDNSDPTSNGRRYEVGAVPVPDAEAIRHADTLAIAREAPLMAVFDLAGEPLTFDFCTFMAAAEIQRRRRGYATGHVAIVPGWRDGLRDESPAYDTLFPPDHRRQRIQDILLPAASLWPAWTGASVFTSRDEAATALSGMTNLHPADFSPLLTRCANMDSWPALLRAHADGLPVMGMKALPGAVAKVSAWLARTANGRKAVTVTLRDYGHSIARNSNMEAWTAFIQELDATRYFAVIVPDSETFLHDGVDVPGATLFPEAAYNLHLRAALYQCSYLNMMVSNGPAALCYFNESARYLQFKLGNDAAPETSLAYVEQCGYELFKDCAFARPGQHFIWEPDDLPVLRREFAKFVACHP